MSDPERITPSEVMFRLDQLSREMDTVSAALNQIERELEPVDEQFTAFVDAYEIGLYQRSISEDGFKLPSESLRFKLAVREMPTDLYGRRTALVKRRERGTKRIGTLKTQIDAQRSLLSALKEEMSATR